MVEYKFNRSSAMKMLMIGADGAHLDAFKRGWTPYIEKRLATADNLPVREDLISRGWSRIALGQGAEVTGALYDRPDLDGSTGWSQKFGMKAVPGFGEKVKPIWQALNELGVKVGVMNVPTIFPAPDVDGFFVSGGGGGAPVVQDIEDDFCHPIEIANKLREWHYIVDERPSSLLGEKGMKTPAEVFDRLCFKNERRAEAFTRLCNEYDVGFGFVVFKSSSVIAELLVMPELAASERVGGQPDTALMQAAERYYRNFDQLVERLIGDFPGAEVLMVSDHGSIVPDYYLNTNSLLAALEYQPRARSKSAVAGLVRKLKKYLPYAVREKLKKSKAIKSRWQGVAVSPPAGSKAFSALLGSWRNGIFINDIDRFGGTIEPGDIPRVCKELVRDINGHLEMQRHGISARLRAVGIGGGSPHYPDIVLDMPDSIMTSAASRNILSTLKLPLAPLGLRAVMEGKLFCFKSSAALAANLSGRWHCSNDERDLTAVYRYVIKSFGGTA